ncbi:hypothetical protein K1719_000633 [Acacia pycnantha]|nr:hypothetical protein K1719_000633 [Acacia pycnantha]
MDLVCSDTVNEFKEVESDVMADVGRPNLADYFPFLKMVDPLDIQRSVNAHIQKVLKVTHDLVNQRIEKRQDKLE